MSDNTKVCQNCRWYRTGRIYSDRVRCINLERENWKGIEPDNTCKDFALPHEYKPDPMWSLLVALVHQKILKNEEEGR